MNLAHLSFTRSVSLRSQFLSVAVVATLAGLLWTAPKSEARKDRSDVDASNTESKSQSTYGQIPIAFEINRGQTHRDVKFIARGSGYSLFLTRKEMVFSLRSNERDGAIGQKVLRMSLVGARPGERIEGVEEFAGKANYLIGDDTRRWIVDVPTFAKVKYTNVYEGVDLLYHGNQHQLEYDFVVAPGKSVRQIQMRYTGADKLSIEPDGSLSVRLQDRVLHHSKPIAYQLIDGQRRQVNVRFRSNGRSLGFETEGYDKSIPLVIDPVLIYSTFLGGSSTEQGLGIALDSQGSAYITGATQSTDFPLMNPLQPTKGVVSDCFVVKLNPAGNAPVYSTYIGGNGDDQANAIAVDAQGSAYIVGLTGSGSFPTTPGVFQPTKDGALDSFLTKLSPSGSSLVYSTFLGGNNSETLFGVAVDAAGTAYVAGRTDSTFWFLHAPFFAPRNGSPVYTSSNSGLSWAPTATDITATVTTAFAQDPTDAATVYAGTNVGVFKTTDSGAHWVLTGTIQSSGAPTATNSIAIDPTNSAVVYVGAPNGVFKSLNGGTQYTSKNSGFGSQNVLKLAIDPSAPSTVYAGTGFGIFKSTNGGDFWTAITNGLPGSPRVNEIVFDPTNSATIYIGTSNGMFKTTNAGGLWTDINTGALSDLLVQVTGLAIDPVAPSTLYAALQPLGNFALYKTTDGGASWAVSDTGLTINTPIGSSPVVPTELSINPTTPSTLYLATSNGGVFKTTNGGSNWSQSNSGLLNVNTPAVIIDRNTPTHLYVGTSIGTDAFVAAVPPNGGVPIYFKNFGGDETDEARGIALDNSGNAYVVGSTSSTNFPTQNAFDSTYNGFTDAFVTKFSTSGSLTFSTFLGGGSGDTGRAIAVRNDNAYVTGSTFSAGFPLVTPIKSTLEQFDSDVFVTKLSNSGTTLDFSTFLGGGSTDQGLGIAVDATGTYVTGLTTGFGFPTVLPAQADFGGGNDAFYTKLSPSGTSILSSTFLGGFSNDQGNAIAVDAAGSAYIAGTTSSSNFPVVNPVQSQLRSSDAFVAKIGESMDLSLSMTDSPDPVLLGSNLTYTITVSNVGTLPATGVILTDPLPAGSTFVSVTPGQGSCNGTATVTCSLGMLNASAQTTVTVTIKPPAITDISNTATVTATEIEPTPANNSTTQATHVSFADLSISGTTAIGNVAPGARMNYVFRVTNLSGSTANSIVVTDNLPVQTTFVSCAATVGVCSGSGNARTITIPALAVGESSSIVIAASLNPAITEGTNVVNTATVSSAIPDINTSNDSVTLNVAATATPLRRKNNGRILYSFDQVFTVKDDASELSVPFGGLTSGLFPRWSPDGTHVAYLSSGSSIDAVDPTGAGRVTIADNVVQLSFPDASTFSWSPDSSRIAYVGSDDFIYLANTSALQYAKLPNSPTGARDIDWSPDGSRFAFSKSGEIFTVNIDGTNLTKLVSTGGDPNTRYTNPLWSPDMTRIMFVLNRTTVFVMNSDGTGIRRLISGGTNFGPAWSPDGAKISYMSGSQLRVINFDGSNDLPLASDGFILPLRTSDWEPVPTNVPLVPSGSSPQVITISGNASDNGFALRGFVKLTGTRGSSITTDAIGNFQFVNLPKGGAFTITPTSPFGTFDPASRTVENLQQDVTGMNFVFIPRTYTIKGVVSDTHGDPRSNVSISLQGGQPQNSTTDSQGKFLFNNISPGAAYRVLISSGRFDRDINELPPFPGDRTVNIIGDVADNSRTIRGHINDAGNNLGSFMTGLTVTLDGGRTAVTTVDSNGNFAFANLPVGLSYTVTPSTADGFTFNTPQFTINNLQSDEFIGTLATTIQPTVVFSTLSKSVGEGDNFVQLIVTRTGNTSTSGTVDYETVDATASERTDYEASFGTLHFAAGEVSKTLNILITDDALIDGDRSFNVILTKGFGVRVPFNSTTTVIIRDNDVSEPAENPLNDSRRFVRQQYADFLNREPDQSGFDFWTDQIESCGSDQQCREIRRINVSAAFFQSIEFQNTGFLVYRMHDIAFGTGNNLKVKSFLHDTVEIGRNVIVGQGNWEQQLETNKRVFAKDFGLTEQFVRSYPLSMANSQFVDILNANAGNVLNGAERSVLVNALNASTLTRGEVVKVFAENPTYSATQFNKAFVLMQYFGYLRRAPHDPPDGNFDGWQFWLNKLNQFNGNFVNAEMVKAFISSTEYLHRFGK